MTKLPVALTVAPVTLSPGAFSTGTGSPVIIDSSTALLPSSTTPSTGTFSPGRTRSRSPGMTDSSGDILLRRRRRGRGGRVFGARSSRARIALLVCERARNSSTWPSSTSVDDDRGRLEIERHAAIRAAERGREDAGRERRDEAVEIGDAGAERDQA